VSFNIYSVLSSSFPSHKAQRRTATSQAPHSAGFWQSAHLEGTASRSLLVMKIRGIRTHLYPSKGPIQRQRRYFEPGGICAASEIVRVSFVGSHRVGAAPKQPACITGAIPVPAISHSPRRFIRGRRQLRADAPDHGQTCLTIEMAQNSAMADTRLLMSASTRRGPAASGQCGLSLGSCCMGSFLCAMTQKSLAMRQGTNGPFKPLYRSKGECA